MHVVVSLFKFQNILIKGLSLTVITNASGYDVIYMSDVELKIYQILTMKVFIRVTPKSLLYRMANFLKQKLKWHYLFSTTI